MKHQRRRPGSWIIVLAIQSLILQQRDVVGAYQLPKTSHRTVHQTPQRSTLLASRDTVPGPASTARTSATISKLASFRDDDRWTALKAFLTTTMQPLTLLVTLSLALAFGMVAWEDYGATNLWPSRHMIVLSTSTSTSTSDAAKNQQVSAPFGSKTVHGLGYGKVERLTTLQDGENMLDNAALLPEIRSYNEVMLEHRTDRTTRWQQHGLKQKEIKNMDSAVADLQDILRQVFELKSLAKDYQWDSIHAIIRDSITPRLEPAATVLRVELNSNKDDYAFGYSSLGYEDIGFDWGSCAWRHCGALADAQEALDELDHLLGVLEPPECLFCLDIVERSIRDMLAVVPAQYHALDGIPAYQKYESAHVSSNEFGDDTDVLDQEYLRMLQELRSSDGEEVE